jgi:predicted acetyltransferase
MLTALMRRQLADVHAAGREAVAALWASESAIYGRYGYGLASEATELEVLRERARLRASPTAAVALMEPADALDSMRAVHAAVWPERPGMIDRDGPWWDVRIEDREDERAGAQALRAAVVEGAAYALYAVTPRWADGRPAGEVAVREVMAATPEGGAAVWGFLLGLDLTSRLVSLLAPRDEPLLHMLASADAARMVVGQGLWVRLVDLPRALTERAYLAPFEVVLEVADDVCPWNAGRWALRWDGSAASCEPTALPAELELGAAELGAAYLGGTTLDVLARAGRVAELRAGALAEASRAFGWDRAPWCPEIF